jgi:cytidylate kinase
MSDQSTDQAAGEKSDDSAMRAITVSREYGSGGGEIARRLAARLGWQLVDHEMVAAVARELGLSEDEADEQDERAESFFGRMLSRLQSIEPNILVNPPLAQEADSRAYHQALHRVVCSAVGAGPCVIVGRGAQRILADRRDVLHIRVVAPLEQRVRYVSHRERLSDAAARARIAAKERDRARYMQTHHQCSPDDAHFYDLVVNTGVLSLDDAVELILRALALKGACVSVPESELGPERGLPRYPGRPGDLHPVG